MLAAGDEYAAVLCDNGKVYALGGLFGINRPSYFYSYRGDSLQEAARNFFPGRVSGLFGKYGYFSALLI